MDIAWTAVILTSAVVLTVIGAAMLVILGAWYVTMFGMFCSWVKRHVSDELFSTNHQVPRKG